MCQGIDSACPPVRPSARFSAPLWLPTIFTGVRAPWADAYRVILSHASNDRAESGNYNVNLIDPGFTVTTSAGTRLTTNARNTYSWNQFNTVGLTVQLTAGENTIMFGNPTGRAPNIDKITVAPASLPKVPR
jgi:hypothetical protein